MRAKSWWWDIALAAALVAVIAAAAAGWTADADLAVRDWVFDHQIGWLADAAWLLNFLGQGWLVMWVLAGSLTGILLIRTRNWRVLLPGVLMFVMTYATIGPLKLWTSRPAPKNPRPDAVELFREPLVADEYLRSFPSGHVVNAIVWWGVIALLAGLLWRLPAKPVRYLRVAAAGIVLFTTTYLSHHWLTDGVAAIALGLLLTRLFHRLHWPTLLHLPAPQPPGRGPAGLGR